MARNRYSGVPIRPVTMHKYIGAISLVAVLAMAGSAAAEHSFDVSGAADWITDLRTDGYRSSKDSSVAAKCAAELKAMRAKGVTKLTGRESFKHWGGVAANAGYDITLDQAAAVCADAAMYTTLLADYDPFASIGRDMYLLSTEFSPGEVFVKKELERAAKCHEAVKAILAAKIPASTPYVIKDHDRKVIAKTVGDLAQNVCEANRKAAAQYTKAAADQEREYNERLKKAGLSGDKLEWMKHYDGQVFLAGGKTPDLPAYAKASVWFAYIYSSDPDINGNHLFTVRRYQFKGAKLVKETVKTYRKPLSFKLSIGSVMR